MHTCPFCRAVFEEDVSFCGICGVKMDGHDSIAPQRPFSASRKSVGGDWDPLLNKVIDSRYRVVKRIDEGGMGAIYLVEHIHMGKLMAMKLLLSQHNRDEELVKRFQREAKAISRLSSIHTIAVFDFGYTEEGLLYLVMEYLKGQSLGLALHREGPMSEAQTADIVSQICDSLSEAHEQGIIHRDLKPENIMLMKTKEERYFVKVLDFGLVKLRGVTEETRTEAITTDGCLVGTPYYMSPEQIRGGDVDQRSDIYSLGALIYRMLTGDPPFKAHTPMAVLSLHLKERPISMSKRKPDLEISRDMEAIVTKALEKAREKRFQSVDDLRRALEGLSSKLNRPESPEPPPGPASKQEQEQEWSWESDPYIGGPRDWAQYEKKVRWQRRNRVLFFFLLLAAIAGGIVVGLKGGFGEGTSEPPPRSVPTRPGAL